jgi:hypothetical protein
VIGEVQQPGISTMKETYKRLQIFMVIVMTPFILTFSTYLRWTQLSQTKFVSSDLTFENQDQEERLSDSENELKVYGSSAFLILFHLVAGSFDQSSHLLSKRLPLRQKTLILRC